MKHCHLAYIVLLVLPLSACSFLNPYATDATPSVPQFTLTSSAFEDGASIPTAFTCDGDDLHPPLSIKDIPEGARSLALVLEEPSIPRDQGVRWIVWNVEPLPMDIAQGELPPGSMQGRNSTGVMGYEGPCPEGESRYVFRVIALDTFIDASAEADLVFLARAMEGHVLGSATLEGVYAR